MIGKNYNLHQNKLQEKYFSMKFVSPWIIDDNNLITISVVIIEKLSFLNL